MFTPKTQTAHQLKNKPPEVSFFFRATRQPDRDTPPSHPLQSLQELWPDRSQLWALILDAPSLSSSRALSADGFGFRPERIVVPNDAELPDTAWPKKGGSDGMRT